jgi:Leucine-rich repeat (LRR) protein
MIGAMRAPASGLTEFPAVPADVRLIDLAWNDLAEVPAWVAGLTELEELRLDGNRLRSLPDLSGLTALRALHLDGNELTSFPGCPPGLEVLFLYGNRVGAIPDRLSPALRHLAAGGNGLTGVPGSLWKLTGLESLNLAENALTEVPAAIGGLTRLRMLDLGHNRLTSIPPELGDLDLTDYLYLSDNQFTEVPEAIGRLDRLTYLNLTDNRLTRLPESLGRMAALVELRLYNNRLRELPADLPPLEKLDLRWNKLDGEPEVLRRLRDQGCVILR